jgi:predicted nucleic acid-binding Zn ribbon protein
MPLYDVVCANGHDDMVYVSTFDKPLPPCEHPLGEGKCGASVERRVSAPGAFVFHGRGTYDHGFVSKRAPKEKSDAMESSAAPTV